MSGSRLFGIVFAAVLLANLATALAQRLWDAAATSRFAAGPAAAPSGYAPFVPSSAPTPTGIPALEALAVRFENAAENRDNSLSCEIAGPGGFGRFLYLEPQGSQGFDALSKGAQVRCSIALGSGSSTMLTYFNLRSAGTYALSLERVPCASCKGQDWRWATVVRDPRGRSDYTHFQ